MKTDKENLFFYEIRVINQQTKEIIEVDFASNGAELLDISDKLWDAYDMYPEVDIQTRVL